MVTGVRILNSLQENDGRLEKEHLGTLIIFFLPGLWFQFAFTLRKFTELNICDLCIFFCMSHAPTEFQFKNKELFDRRNYFHIL